MKGKKDTYAYQQETKDRHESEIIAILNGGPKRFNELKMLTNRAPRGLSITLKNLAKRQRVERVVDEATGKIVYKIT